MPCREIGFIYNSVQISGKVFYKSFIIQAAFLAHITATTLICTNLLRDLRISEEESVVLTFPSQFLFHFNSTAAKTG